MKYYIVGKNSHKGASHDTSGDLNEYYELGWELMITHPEVKKLKYKNLITDDDIIVTTSDERKFLYEDTFKNVISWDNFKKLNIGEDYVIDLVNKSMETSNLIGKLEIKDALGSLIEDENIIKILFSFKKNEDIIEKIKDNKYVCLQYRKRDWVQERNMDDDFFSSLISLFVNNFKLKVFIVGFGGEKFCDDINSIYVNLQDFTTLINHKNCELYFSSMSGPAHLSLFFGNENLKHIVNDITGHRMSPGLQNHPLFMGGVFNYSKTKINIIFGKFNNINEMVKIINYLK